MESRTELAVLDGPGVGQRLVVSLIQELDGRLQIDLREQNLAEGIGWFDQRALQIEPRQFRQLQAVLGLSQMDRLEEAVEVKATLPFPGPRSEQAARPTGSDS